MEQNKKNKYGKNPQSHAQKKTPLGNLKIKTSLQDDLKPTFAAYLNLARQNMYDTLCHISSMIGISETTSEDNMSSLSVITKLNNNKEVETRDFIMRQLLSQFPMLKAMAEVERVTKDKKHRREVTVEEFINNRAGNLQLTITADKVYKIICSIAKVLNTQRNAHTHYCHQGDANIVNEEKDVAKYVDTSFLAAIQATKERFPESQDVVTQLIQDRYKRNGKKYVPNYDAYFAMSKENGEMTPMALIYLICQLLNKHQAAMFLDKLDQSFYGDKNIENEPKEVHAKKEERHRMMREVFSIFRIRMAKERIRSERSDYALALDMLNEVNKCPRELFSHLNADIQENFRIVTDKTIKDENNETGEVLLLRRDDRFPYFALRYIDDMELFQALRFQVNYGKYRYVFKEDKKCADGEVQPRILQYELNGFGRLNEIEKRRLSVDETHQWDGTALIRTPRDLSEDDKKDENQSKADEPKGDEQPANETTSEAKKEPELVYDKDNAQTKPYITDCTTHYMINDNHIGIDFSLTSAGDIRMGRGGNIYNMPQISEQFTTNENGVVRKKILAPTRPTEKDVIKERNKMQPICRMSIFELPAMIFHQLLYADVAVQNGGQANTSISKTEDIIRQCVYNYQRLFRAIYNREITPGQLSDDDIKKDYGLLMKDIPQKLQDYIHGIQPKASICSKKELTEKYRLTKEDIPEKLRGPLFSYKLTPFEEYAIVSIAKMLKQTESKMRIYDETLTAIVESGIGDTPKNRVGRRSYKEFKAGSLANFLARDIVRMQPSQNEGKDRPTGLNYRKMQASIAQYGGTNGITLAALKLLFENLGLTGKGSEIKHPFLLNVLNESPKNTVDFYCRYLVARKRYLESITFDKLASLPFLHSNQTRWKNRDAEYYKALAQSYYSDTIDLPTGLFLDSIKARLLELYPDKFAQSEMFDINKESVTRLIARYHAIVNRDSSQKMYSYARNYKIFDLLSSSEDPVYHKTRDCNCKNLFTELKDAIAEETDEIEKSRCRKYFNEFSDNERTLRRFQVQDILAFMMAKDILSRRKPITETVQKSSKSDNRNNENVDRGNLEGLTQNFEDCKLKDVRPKSGKSILEQSVPFEMTLTFKNGSRITITQEELKMKNYGDFFMVLSDSRIESLLPYIQDIDIKNVSREKLEEELDMYDRRRVDVFRNIQNIEKQILKEAPELRNAKFKVDNGSEIYVTNNFNTLLSEFGVNATIHGILVNIRNAFCHNHYTDRDCVRINDVELGAIADRIAEIAKQKGNLHNGK